MTSDEFTAARERLGLTLADVAAEFGLTPAVVDAMGAGSVKVPRDMAKHLEWRVAVAEQQAVLDASGLPACPTADELDRATSEKSGDDLMAALQALNAHAETCPTCTARAEYLERHGPSIPDLPLPWWARAVDHVVRLTERLPAGLRPPEGDVGEGRRVGLVVAAAFSAFALLLMAVAMVGQIATGRLATAWRELAPPALLIPVGYFVGFYLAGWAFDVTRPFRHRLIAYVLRGALCAASIYGTIGLVMPLFDDESEWSTIPEFVGFMAAIGSLIGAGWWIKDRVTRESRPSA